MLQNAGLDEQHTVLEAEVDPPRERAVDHVHQLVTLTTSVFDKVMHCLGYPPSS